MIFVCFNLSKAFCCVEICFAV